MNERIIKVTCFCLLMLGGGKSVWATPEPIKLSAYKGNDHDGEHTRQRMPSRLLGIPDVEIDSDKGALVFESSSDQMVSYSIRSMSNEVVLDGELFFGKGAKVSVSTENLSWGEEYCLFLYIGNLVYVGVFSLY